DGLDWIKPTFYELLMYLFIRLFLPMTRSVKENTPKRVPQYQQEKIFTGHSQSLLFSTPVLWPGSQGCWQTGI
ncbi:MAG: hypothetical protein ACE5I1_18950, partial [bacterium]